MKKRFARQIAHTNSCVYLLREKTPPNSLPLTTESLYKKIKEQKARIKARKESEQNSADKKDSPQAQEEKRENENSAVSEQ